MGAEVSDEPTEAVCSFETLVPVYKAIRVVTQKTTRVFTALKTAVFIYCGLNMFEDLPSYASQYIIVKNY
jgi:hypothetical protein